LELGQWTRKGQIRPGQDNGGHGGISFPPLNYQWYAWV
jgi:hypothetical protein